MNLIDLLQSKKVKVKKIPKWGEYLRNQWECNFANHLSREEKETIYLHDTGGACGYLWHLFSYQMKDCLTKDEAQTAFNNVPKNSCYVFYQNSDYALILENASMVNAEDFTNETDIYVVDTEFNWTYVKTHETGWCGPYFSQKDCKD
ncbi:DUF4275 family protein [Paenibacillus elgii]|uniref:DUF4275 family protein n=1 Tax=Paenibacillus elgii TaxID=189691 RepID=UPI000248D581|nr:DUF4275 family protein [Paenibacillus elgii]